MLPRGVKNIDDDDDVRIGQVFIIFILYIITFYEFFTAFQSFAHNKSLNGTPGTTPNLSNDSPDDDLQCLKPNITQAIDIQISGNFKIDKNFGNSRIQALFFCITSIYLQLHEIYLNQILMFSHIF